MFLPIEELKRRAKAASRVAIEENKLLGIPNVYANKDGVFKEYRDGTKVLVLRKPEGVLDV